MKNKAGNMQKRHTRELTFSLRAVKLASIWQLCAFERPRGIPFSVSVCVNPIFKLGHSLESRLKRHKKKKKLSDTDCSVQKHFFVSLCVNPIFKLGHSLENRQKKKSRARLTQFIISWFVRHLKNAKAWYVFKLTGAWCSHARFCRSRRHCDSQSERSSV